MNNIKKDLENFINNSTWIFAKTYAKTWPHEYIVQENVKNNMFMKLANHIDSNGYKNFFYNKEMIFFDYNEYTYWHMENIINRCVLADTYHQRKIEDRLPEE